MTENSCYPTLKVHLIKKGITAFCNTALGPTKKKTDRLDKVTCWACKQKFLSELKNGEK